MKSYDLIVIGGGPGGYPAAIRGAQRGLKVALVEKGELGGTCLNRGCIPSKAVIAAAEMAMRTRRGERIGVKFSPPEIDFAKIVADLDRKVAKLRSGIAGLLKGNQVEVVAGEATLQSPREVSVGGEIYQGRFLLLATGTEPIRPSFLPFDGRSIVTTDELFRLSGLPRRLLVIGGGVIGCETACAYNLLGSEVTVVELLPELLPQEGGLVSRTLRTIFEKRGIRVRTGTQVEKIGRNGEATLSDGEVVEADVVLAAIGRRLGKDRLGLGSVGVAVERGFVKVDDAMETTVEGIYAVGDLVGKTLLAHGASAEGISAVENIVGNESRIDYASIPRVTYTIPEIASVGARESELKSSGVSYKAGRFSYLANSMAMIHEETEGFAELTVGADDQVLGAVVVGSHAADLIQQAAIVMKNKLPVRALIDTVFAHPTISEILHEAAEDSHGMAIHKLGRGRLC